MTGRIPPTSDRPHLPPPSTPLGQPGRADAAMRAIEAWSRGQRQAREGARVVTVEREQSIRCDALGHAIAALGDSALTHDGWLRPRVWELADQIAAYIADGSRP